MVTNTTAATVHSAKAERANRFAPGHLKEGEIRPVTPIPCTPLPAAVKAIAEVCVCDLGEILGISQSAVSQHLARFKAYGLVSVRRDNQTIFYRLSDKVEVKLLRKVALDGIAFA